MISGVCGYACSSYVFCLTCGCRCHDRDDLQRAIVLRARGVRASRFRIEVGHIQGEAQHGSREG